MPGIVKAPNLAWGHERSPSPPPFLPSQFSQAQAQESKSPSALTKAPSRTNAGHFLEDLSLQHRAAVPGRDRIPGSPPSTPPFKGRSSEKTTPRALE